MESRVVGGGGGRGRGIVGGGRGWGREGRFVVGAEGAGEGFADISGAKGGWELEDGAEKKRVRVCGVGRCRRGVGEAGGYRSGWSGGGCG